MVVLGEIGTAFALYLRENPVGRAGVGVLISILKTIANSVRVVVLIYPSMRTVEVVTPDDTTLLTENDILTLDLLPDFAVPVKSLFSGI